MASAAPVVLYRRHVYMLPTGPGYLFGVSALAMLLTATNYGNGLAYGFCFLLVAIALVSMLFTQRNLQGLSVSPVSAEPVFAGEHARFPIVISCPDSVARLALWLENDSHPDEFCVLPGESVRRSVSLPAAERGRLSIPAVRLASRYPLGIFFAWSRPIHMTSHCLVFPRPAPPSPFQLADSGGSDRLGLLQREGEDFFGFHDYQAGDSYRHIHWKSLPKSGSLQVKTFAGTQQSELWFDLAAAPGPGLEAQLSQLCRWIIDAETQQLYYGLRIGATTVPPDLGSAHRTRCLTLLALYPAQHPGEGA
jgi:uncharacterized protein (DUF58 family)